jgi:type I restriction enzyme S subunit
VGARYGNAAIFPFEGDYGVYVSLTHIRASQKLDNTFLKFLLNSPIGKTQAKKGVFQGGGVPNLNVKVVEKFKINFPSKPEQQKIAAFLTAVDAKIEQLIKKKELLDEYKKGLMQQIFSQAIRFKADDGSDFPDWKENKVDEFMEVTRGQVLAVPEMRQVESEIFKYPVYSSQTKNNGLTGYYTDYLFEDCITWTTDGANAGDVNYRAGKFYCTNVCGVLRSKKGYANLCIAQILNSVSRRYVSYVGNPKLMNNVMEKIKISIPSSINEQTKIANFLSSVDSKIEEVGKQLDESKQFKKALLQKMFV